MAAYYFRVPRYAGMPHLSTMLDSIGNDRAVAKLLGLSPRTIAKYRAQECSAAACHVCAVLGDPLGG